MEKLQTKKEWLNDRTVASFIVGGIAACLFSAAVSVLVFGVGLVVLTFQQAIGASISSFCVIGLLSTGIFTRSVWKSVLAEAETKTFKAE